MATPTNNLPQVEFVQQPSRTWRINRDTLRIDGETDGYGAVRQAVEIILNTERFRWQIYRPYSGVELEILVGQDAGYVSMELRRRVQEALMADDRVTGISDYAFLIRGDTLYAMFTVSTVYGDIETGMEVALND